MAGEYALEFTALVAGECVWHRAADVDRARRQAVALSEWANSFKIGRDGTREVVIANYEQHLYDGGLISQRYTAIWQRRRDDTKRAY